MTAPAVRYYTVVDGDTATKISMKLFGNPTGWRVLLDRNGIHDPRVLTAGMILRVS